MMSFRDLDIEEKGKIKEQRRILFLFSVGTSKKKRRENDAVVDIELLEAS